MVGVLGPEPLFLCAEETADPADPGKPSVPREAALTGVPRAAPLHAITMSYLHSLSLQKYLLSAWRFCLFCTIPAAES